MYFFSKSLGVLSLIVCVSFSVAAQTGVAVNTTGNAPTTGTMLDVTSADNTSSTYGLRVNTDRFVVRGDGMMGVGQLPENNIQLTVRSINLGSTIGELSIAQQWNTNVGNSQYLRLFSRKSFATGGWSGSDLYLQRYVDADGNAMGFIKWAAGDWGIELGSGTNTYFKVRNSGGAIVRGNGGILDIEATDHGYIQWYPQGIAAGRKAYTGFPGAGSIDFSVANQNPNGRIDLVTAAGGSVRLNSLAGMGNRVVIADASGSLKTGQSVASSESRYTVFVRRVNQTGSTWATVFTETDEYGLPYPAYTPGGATALNHGSPYSGSGTPQNINPYYIRIDADGWLGGGNNFSLIYDFYIVFPTAGTYTFSMPRSGSNSAVDDVGAFYAGPLNDLNPAAMSQRLMYQQLGQVPTSATWTVTVAAGDIIRSRAYFSQGTGDVVFDLRVSGGSYSNAIIPMSWVYNIK